MCNFRHCSDHLDDQSRWSMSSSGGKSSKPLCQFLHQVKGETRWWSHGLLLQDSEWVRCCFVSVGAGGELSVGCAGVLCVTSEELQSGAGAGASTVTSCFSPLYSRCSTLQTTIWMMLVKWRTMFVKMLCWDASRLLYCLWIGYRWLSFHLWMIMYLKLENWCITCIAFIYWLYSKNAVRSILQIRTVRLFKKKWRTFHGKYPFWNELLLIFKSKHY